MEYDEYLQHYGILGMRWGVRRYQNKDGTLTPAGKKRAEKLSSEYEKITGNKVGEKSSSKKSIKDYSDDELRNMTNRLRLEKDYIVETKNYINAKTELSNLINKKQISAGKAFVEKYGSSVVKTLWNDVGKNNVNKYLENVLGLKDQSKANSEKLKRMAEDMENKKKIALAEDYFKNRNKKQEKSDK